MKFTAKIALCLFFMIGSSSSLFAEVTKETSTATQAKHAGLGVVKALTAGAQIASAGFLLSIGYISFKEYLDPKKRRVRQADVYCLMGAFTAIVVPTLLAAAYTLGKSSIASFKQAAAKSPSDQEPKTID